MLFKCPKCKNYEFVYTGKNQPNLLCKDCGIEMEKKDMKKERRWLW